MMKPLKIVLISGIPERKHMVQTFSLGKLPRQRKVKPKSHKTHNEGKTLNQILYPHQQAPTMSSTDCNSLIYPVQSHYLTSNIAPCSDKKQMDKFQTLNQLARLHQYQLHLP